MKLPIISSTPSTKKTIRSGRNVASKPSTGKASKPGVILAEAQKSKNKQRKHKSRRSRAAHSSQSGRRFVSENILMAAINRLACPKYRSVPVRRHHHSRHQTHQSAKQTARISVRQLRTSRRRRPHTGAGQAVPEIPLVRVGFRRDQAEKGPKPEPKRPASSYILPIPGRFNNGGCSARTLGTIHSKSISPLKRLSKNKSRNSESTVSLPAVGKFGTQKSVSTPEKARSTRKTTIVHQRKIIYQQTPKSRNVCSPQKISTPQRTRSTSANISSPPKIASTSEKIPRPQKTPRLRKIMSYLQNISSQQKNMISIPQKVSNSQKISSSQKAQTPQKAPSPQKISTAPKIYNPQKVYCPKQTSSPQKVSTSDTLPLSPEVTPRLERKPPVLDSRMSIPTRIERIQKFIDEFEYNHSRYPNVYISKRRNLSSLMETAERIMKKAMPIKCMEAVVLAIRLTKDIDKLVRMCLRFKSTVDGQTYWHVVLCIQFRGKFGTIGLSRKPQLGYKEIKYESIYDLVMEFRRCYETVCGHALHRMTLGLPVGTNPFSSEPVYWEFLKLPFTSEFLSEESSLFSTVLARFCERVWDFKSACAAWGAAFNMPVVHADLEYARGLLRLKDKETREQRKANMLALNARALKYRSALYSSRRSKASEAAKNRHKTATERTKHLLSVVNLERTNCTDSTQAERTPGVSSTQTERTIDVGSTQTERIIDPSSTQAERSSDVSSTQTERIILPSSIQTERTLSAGSTQTDHEQTICVSST
eukprot:238654_1